MAEPILDISVRCVGDNECLYRGKDILLDVSVVNRHRSEVGFPLAYLQKTGMIVKLTNTRTGEERYIPTTLADTALLNEFTVLQPGQSLPLRCLLQTWALEQFGEPYVDLSVEITVMARIKVDENLVLFRGTDKLRIMSEKKDKK